MRILRTDGRNEDFIELCRLLDENLDELVGGAIQRTQFAPHNTLEKIRNALVLYVDETLAAGGSFRYYEEGTAEIKRIFVRKDFRGRGLSKVLMEELENWAREEGYRRLILETGIILTASVGLYRSVGFRVIGNYGPYRDIKESLCMEKEIRGD